MYWLRSNYLKPFGSAKALAQALATSQSNRNGVVRFQHQSTHVQIADILTKDLGSKLHRAHRDVLFGRKQTEICPLKLPDSYRTYLTRHNDELVLNARKLKLSTRAYAQACAQAATRAMTAREQ